MGVGAFYSWIGVLSELNIIGDDVVGQWLLFFSFLNIPLSLVSIIDAAI